MTTDEKKTIEDCVCNCTYKCQGIDHLIGKKIEDQKFKAYKNGEITDLKLSDYYGKWLILFFYPADFSFVCPTELEEMANYYEEFKKEEAEVLSVSTDTVYVHKAWHDQSPAVKKIIFPMVADPAGKLCRAFGTYLLEEGISLRGSFIIDPEGIIKAYEIHSNNIGRSAAELLRKLQAARFVAKHIANVCPASWKPGKETLKTSLDLVGKI